MITELTDKQIFVFGSNLAGNHAGGAARQAHDDFGAEMGVGEGLTGQSYAFPTLDEHLRQRNEKELEESRDLFFKTANENPDKEFLMTAVGTGIAGFSKEVMVELFKNPPPNVVVPEEWSSPL